MTDKNGPFPPLLRRQFLGGGGAAALLAWLPRRGHAATDHLDITKIASGVYVHTGQHAIITHENRGDISNPGFIIGDDSVAVVDTSGCALSGAALRAAVMTVTDKPIRYVINTHMHPDHVLGNAAFESDKPEFVGHHKLARALAARTESYLRRAKETLGDAFEGTRIIVPTRPITEPTKLDLGNRVLTLTPRPTAHTDNDLTIRDETTNTVFLGDLVFSGHLPTLDGSIRGWLKLFDVLKEEKADRIVPGHGPAQMPWPDAAEPTRHYLQVVADEVRAMIKDGKTITDAVATAGQSERSNWLLFDEHHARNVTAAFAELEWE